MIERWYCRLEHTFGGKICVGASTLDVGPDGLLTPQPSAEDVETVCNTLPAVFRRETVEDAPPAASSKKKG